jgi:hypothetical protein
VARYVSAKWKQIEPDALASYKKQAGKDMHRYRKEMEEFDRKDAEKKKEQEQCQERSTPPRLAYTYNTRRRQ